MSQVEKSSVSDMSTSNAKTATFADALLEQKDDKTDALPSYRERKNIHFTGQSNDYGVTPQMKCVNGFVAFTSPYVALTTRTSALGLNTVWRCVVCHKVKDLKGPHLDGKANVRSDCWPCGKKTTFLRDASAMSESGAVAEPAASNTQAPSNADRAVHAAGGTNASVFAASAATSSSQALASPSGVTSMPAGTAPFKSAFGGVSAPDAAKPAAAPFKSAFGDVSAPDAARPAAAPFKSACEGVVEWLAPKPPIGSAMKSSLGAARDEALVISSLTASSEKGMSSGIWQSPKAVSSSTVAARGEAAELGQSGCVLPESVWRCVVCHKVKDLKGPHLDGKASVRSDCWPCGKKTTFVQEDSGDRSLMGADGRASRLAEAAGNEGVPVLREPRSTVFKDPVVPSEAEEPRCMLPVTKAGGVQGSAAQDTSVVVLSTNALWRCAVCHKVKDLKGPHLDGKASVRSDCWPCGKKTTFLRDASAMSESGAVAEPAASNTQAPSNADRAVHAAGGTNASVFAASAATSSSQALVSPSGVTSMPAGTAPFKSAFGGVSAPDAARPAAAPFKSAFGDVSASDAAKPAAAPFKSAFGGVSAPDAARPAAAPFKSAFGDVSAPDAAKPAAAPFKSAFGGVSAPDAARPAAAPFKSAFGDVSAPDAAKPAAAPFKSAFGGVSAPDAARPAAAPFKSAFGDVSAPDAARPAAAPFKSAFGDVSAPDAAKPAAAPFKSAFGDVSASDAAKPAAAPFKSAFGGVSAPDAARPAAAPFKSAFGDVSAPDAAKPAAAPFKSAFGGVSAPDAAKPAAAPFKSAFGGVPAPDAAKPAAAPFKSAFGGVSAPDAARPAAAPFKSAFGDVSAPDAAKPAAAPFKSAFGGVSAPDAAKPAAAPFKSAFGGVPAPDAAKPAAAPFKSAFGGVSAPDAARPAAAPFKSACEGVVEWLAPKPPIGSAMKSSLGAARDEALVISSLTASSEKGMSSGIWQSPKAVSSSTVAARGEAAELGQSGCVLPESVWRCVVCHKVKDLKGPHLDGKASVRSDCWPCGKKTTFVQEDSGDRSLMGADGRASRLAEAAGNEGVPVLREPRSTVFKDPVVPSEAEEPRCMLPVTKAGGVQGSAAQDTSVVVLSTNALWRCAVCHKVKDLKGPHLDGKASVRSDCWPCGKKTTFLRDASAMSESGAVAEPAASNTQAPSNADRAVHAAGGTNASVFAASAATSSSQALVSPSGVTSMPAGTAPFKSAFGGVSAPDAARPAAAPFKSAFGDVSASDAAKPAAAPFKSAFGGVSAPDAARPAAAPFKSAFGDVSAPDAAKPAAAPFKSAFGGVSAPDAARPAAAPFKSAFGDVSAPDAAKPAAAPFKSAFGGVSAPDAARPAAAPFKSAFGDVSAPDAARPAAAPFKSAFGDVSAPDAAKPAAAPFKSAFGDVSASDAAKPAAAPFKSAFGGVSAPDAARPAAAPFKSAFGDVSAPDAAKPAAAPFKSAFGGVSAPDAAKPAAAPFKSAFGGVPAPDAAKPAAAPFKSAFGGVSAPDAARPAAAPFKSAFGDVSAPDAAKPAAAPFKSAFGGVSAPDAAKPAAAPFKSAFGGVPAPDAAKPAAAPFKSAFGGVSAPDAARPAAAPFKSACEGVVEWLAPKPPIGSAMKSSLGAARDEALVISSLTASSEKGMSSGIWQSPKAVSSSTVAARGEAAELGQSGCVLPESVWRCVVCHKVKDLKGPHLDGKASVRSDCWPCGKKTTFVQEDSGDRSLMGADGRASRLAEAAGNEGVPVLREPRSTVFKDPVVPSEAEEPRCMLPVTKAGGVQGSAAQDTSVVVLSTNALWRCAVCHKVKDLKGPHLDGKASVRSDCWPCGKKTTFLRDASAMSESGAVAEPAASNTQAPSNADRAVHAAGGTNASVFAASAATSSSQALVSPSGVTSMPAGTAPFKSAFGGVSAPDAARPAAAPFKSAFGDVSAPDAAKPAAAPFKSACEGVVEWLAPKPPIGSAMKSSLGAARDEALVISSLTASSEKGMSSGIWQSPKAVSSSTVAARGEAAELGQSGCVLPESVWRCVVCHKVKDLKGPHLDGKASVRSDCWPCGKKTTFVQEDSGDRSLMGADGRASRLAEAAGNEGVPVLREPRSTVFKDPVVPSEAEEPRCMLPVTKAGGVQGSAAQDTSVVVLSTNALWRCAVCHKVKDLKGPHLDGKASVRSDCWPCGKKTTFLRDASAMSESGAVAEPAASNTQAPSNADRAVHAAGGTNASVFAASAATSSSQALVSPSGVTSMPAGTAPFKSAFGGVSAPDAARPAAAPFKSAFGDVSAPDAAKPAAAPFKSAFGDVSAPDAAKPAAAPFKSAFGGVSAPDAAKPAAAPLKIVYDDTRDVSDSEIGKEVKECLKLKEESDGREGDLFATGGEFGVLGSTAGGPGNAGGAGLALSSSCEMGCSKALVPSVASECCSSAVVEKLITRALKEQRVEMKKELECFRKDLLFEVRQAISQEHVHAVAKDQACFEEPPAQMMESLIRRHLSKAFRKS